jgi:uncharacterized protein (DUF983 family)
MLRQRMRWDAPKIGSVVRLCVVRAIKRHCPQCGRGRLFASWARLSERCDVCGLVFRREDGAELGSMYLSATVSQVFAAAVFAVVWLTTDWSAELALAIGAPLVVAFCYGFLPLSMALWTAIEYVTDVSNREWWAHPRA